MTLPTRPYEHSTATYPSTPRSTSTLALPTTSPSASPRTASRTASPASSSPSYSTPLPSQFPFPPSPAPTPPRAPRAPRASPPAPIVAPTATGSGQATPAFLFHLKRNSAADLLDSVEWVTDTFASLRTQLRDRDAELALTRDYVAYLEQVIEDREARIERLEARARRDQRVIERHREGLGIAWMAMMPREAQGMGVQNGQGGNGGLSGHARVQRGREGQWDDAPEGVGRAL